MIRSACIDVINSGPYIEQLSGSKKLVKMADGTYLFAFPLPEGAVPHIYLDNFAAYIDWIFQNPAESNGMTLDLATAHVTGDDVAAAFTAVTGKPAKFQAIPVEMWHAEAWKGLPKGKDTKIGFNSVKDDSHLQLMFEQNFGICITLVAGTRVSSRGIMSCWIGSCRAE